MKVIPYLYKASRRDIVVVAGTAFAGGIASAALVAVVNASLHQGIGRGTLALGFLAILLVKVLCAVGSNRLLIRLSQDTIFELSDELCRRVARTPYRRLEDIGAGRIMACLTDDVMALSNAIQALPPLLVNVAVLAGCGIYLAWVSWTAILGLLLLGSLGAVFYRGLLRRASVAIRDAREKRNVLFGHFRTLTDGIKELKLNGERREAFLNNEIGGSIAYLRERNIRAMGLHATADSWSQAVFYSVLGLLLFALPAVKGITLESLTAYVFTALYISTRCGRSSQDCRSSRAATKRWRLTRLGLSLRTHGDATPAVYPSIARRRPSGSGRAVLMRGQGLGLTFELGPLNLELQPGELVFVIGGNGSGSRRS